MDKVYPFNTTFPRIGQDIWVYVGEPVTLEPLIKEHRRLHLPEDEIRRRIMAVLTKEMHKVKAHCEAAIAAAASKSG